MAYYDALIAKWGTLSGTTQAKLTTINALTVNGTAQPAIIPTYKIYNAIVPADFTSLTAANQQLIRDIFGMGTVDASPGTNVRTVVQNIFTGKATTLANLGALVAPFDTPQIPWWQATVAQGGGGLSSPVAPVDLAAAGGLV